MKERKPSVCNVFGFEAKRFFLNKWAFGLIVVFFVILVGFSTFSFLNSQPSNDEDLSREEFRVEYQQQIEESRENIAECRAQIAECEAIISAANSSMLTYEAMGTIEQLENRIEARESLIELNTFYLESDSNTYDYINDGDINTKFLHYRPEKFPYAGYTFYLMLFLKVILPIFAIIAAVCIFTLEYTLLTLKNLFTSQISRRNIYRGKLLFLLTAVVGLWCVLMVYSSAYGLVDNNAKILIYVNGGYKAVSWAHVFFAQALGLLVNTLFLTSITVVTGISSRNSILAAAVPSVFYILINSISIFINSGSGVIRNYFPIVSLQNNWVTGFTREYIIMLVVECFCAAVMFVIAKAVIRRQDV